MSARLRHARRLTLSLTTAAAIAAAGITVLPSAASATATPTCASAGVTITALHGPVFYTDSGTSPALTSAYAGYQVGNGTGVALNDTWVQLSGFTGGSVGLGGGQPAAEQIPVLGTNQSKSLFWYLTAGATSATAQNHTITVYSHRPDLANATVLCTATGGFSSVSSTIGANANKITSVGLSTQTPSLGSTFSVTVNGNTGTIGSGPAGDPGSFWMSPSSISGWPAAAYRLVGTSLLISPDGTAAQQTYTDLLHLTNLGSSARDYAATYTFQAVGFTATDASLQPAQQIASGTQIKHTGSYPATIPAIHPATNTLSVALTRTPARLPTGGGTANYTATLSGTSGATVDSFTVTLPSGASVVPGSASYNGTPVADPSSSGTALVFQGPFALAASPAPLTFQVSFDGTTGTRTVAAVASVGSTVIDTTPNTLTDAVPATAAVVINTAPVAGDDAPTVGQNAAATTVPVLGNDTDRDGDSLSVTGIGTASHGSPTLTAGVVRYAPNAGYTGPDAFTYSISDGNGGTSSATVHVTVAALTAQTITFAQPSDLPVTSAPVGLTATASSGLPVSFSSSTPAVCTVDSGTGVVTPHATGTCTVAADQAGSASYAAAATVTRSFGITRAPQRITFPAPSDVSVDQSGVSVTATAGSGGPITFTSSTTGVCDVDATTGAVTLHGLGTCTISADQAGSASYYAAPTVTRSFEVTDAPALAAQTITFAPPADVQIDATGVAMIASADSGLDVTFSSDPGTVCTVDAATGAVTLLTTGTCTITATQPGDASYTAATPVTHSFLVSPDAQTVIATQPGAPRVADGPVVVTGSADSGLAVTYRSTTTAVCTVDADGTVTLAGPGTCSIVVEQAGNARYAPASTTVDFTVRPDLLPQSLDFPTPGAVAVTSGTTTVTATASSGLTPVYNSLTPTVCTVDAAGTVTVFHIGACTLQADQAGDGTYAAAPAATITVQVVPAAQTITFPQPADTTATATAIAVAATASSGLPATYTSATPLVCTVDPAGAVTLHVAGTCSITAHQAGDATHAPAADVTRDFTVSHAAQSIDSPVPTSLDVSAGPTAFPATSGSGEAVTVAAGPSGVCTATISAERVTLVPVAAGACTVTLFAPGTAVYGPVSHPYPVTITATVTNDVYTVPPSVSAGAGVVLHVLANDTPGMTLVSVTQPAHGRVTVGGGTLTFTPTASFKGTETFTYTTVDGDGGRHTATVTITVPDTAPVVHPGATGTVAGRAGTVTLHPTDVNGDAVTLTTGRVPGAVVTVVGPVLHVVPTRSFSGMLRIPVTADDGDGGITHTVVTVRVDPLPATHAVRTLTQSGTRLHWNASPATDARYEIRVNGVLRCVTTSTTCVVDSLIGPRARVVVTVLGHERTRSVLTLALPRLGAAVRVGTVYFATDSARPSRSQRAVALAIKLRLYRAGFTELSLIGFTDSRGSAEYNIDLSRRRALAVQHLLGYGARISVRSSWRGKSSPAQSNATVRGMALNRRVEVWIR